MILHFVVRIFLIYVPCILIPTRLHIIVLLLFFYFSYACSLRCSFSSLLRCTVKAVYSALCVRTPRAAGDLSQTSRLPRTYVANAADPDSTNSCRCPCLNCVKQTLRKQKGRTSVSLTHFCSAPVVCLVFSVINSQRRSAWQLRLQSADAPTPAHFQQN